MESSSGSDAAAVGVLANDEARDGSGLDVFFQMGRRPEE
jgi:hypothetical protein